MEYDSEIESGVLRRLLGVWRKRRNKWKMEEEPELACVWHWKERTEFIEMTHHTNTHRHHVVMYRTGFFSGE